MAAFNLVRNTRVFFTTNVGLLSGTSSAVLATGMLPANTVELQVLDGFSFSQATQTTNIQLSEAGDTPVRGQRTFNTSLDPVDFSFSTYIRPVVASTKATCEEKVLWNALMSAQTIDLAGTVITGATGISRTVATTSVATIAGTSMVTTGMTVGDIITISGATGANSMEWNTPVQITSISATAIVVNYISAPLSVAALAPASVSGIKYFKGAWAEHVAATPAPAFALATFAGSNKNQLQAFGIVFVVDGATFVVDNCAMDQAVVDFGIDAIAMVAWTGKGTQLRQLTSAQATLADVATVPTFTGTSIAGTSTAKSTGANYITNKLSTVSLVSNIAGVSGTSYVVALTGGSITFANNITYITPANLGVVNKAVSYFTGTRAISGSLNAYLRVGTNTTATLLTDILNTAATAADTRYRLQIEIGGAANATRVEIEMDGAMLMVPTTETADIISTVIGFSAQGTTNSSATGSDCDITSTNEASVRYFSG